MNDAKRRRVAFVHVKGFSGINDRLIEAIQPPYTVTARVDGFAAIDPRRPSPAALANLAVTLATYGLAGRSGSRLLKTAFAFRRMTRYVERQLAQHTGRFDVLLQTETLCGAGAAANGVPYVIYTDCTLPLAGRVYAGWAGPAALARLEADTLRRADLVLLHNTAAQQSLVEDYGLAVERTAVIGCGVDLPAAPAGAQRNPQRIACVTTDPDRHRVGVLRRAFAQHVRPAHAEAELVLAGGRIAQTGPPAPGEELHGALNRDALVGLLAETGIYVMPSKAGGYSSVLDAMALGCACVVAKDNPFLGPTVIEGKTALVSPRGEAEDLAERIDFLLAHPDEAARLGEAAAARVRADCAWPAVAGRLVAAIEERY